MSTIRKFAFDTEFAPDGGIVSVAPPKLGPDEVAAECAKAYERGTQDAVARAEQDSAAALQALANAASAVLTRLDAESSAMRDEAAQVALAAARKIAGVALEAFGEQRVLHAIESAMDALRHQPRLLVKIPPDYVDKIGPRIAELSETHAYAGAVLVRPQEGMRPGEVVVDWSDGVVTLSPEDAAQRIENLVSAALATPSHA